MTKDKGDSAISKSSEALFKCQRRSFPGHVWEDLLTFFSKGPVSGGGSRLLSKQTQVTGHYE